MVKPETICRTVERIAELAASQREVKEIEVGRYQTVS